MRAPVGFARRPGRRDTHIPATRPPRGHIAGFGQPRGGRVAASRGVMKSNARGGPCRSSLIPRCRHRCPTGLCRREAPRPGHPGAVQRPSQKPNSTAPPSSAATSPQIACANGRPISTNSTSSATLDQRSGPPGAGAADARCRAALRGAVLGRTGRDAARWGAVVIGRTARSWRSRRPASAGPPRRTGEDRARTVPAACRRRPMPCATAAVGTPTKGCWPTRTRSMAASSFPPRIPMNSRHSRSDRPLPSGDMASPAQRHDKLPAINGDAGTYCKRCSDRSTQADNDLHYPTD